jgi:hypothetical protein
MKATLDEWMQSTLSKQHYDELLRDMPLHIGVSEKTWQNYRLGKTKPQVDIFLKIQEVFARYNYTITLNDVV